MAINNSEYLKRILFLEIWREQLKFSKFAMRFANIQEVV